MQTEPSIVFVHGLWSDGSCFSKVIPPLQAEGYEVIASQHSLDSVKGDADAVKRVLGRVSSPAILVGHSYGGTVITAAGTDDRVAGLVYGVSTIGNVFGTLLTTFTLIPAFGSRAITYIFALVLAACAGLLFLSAVKRAS